MRLARSAMLFLVILSVFAPFCLAAESDLAQSDQFQGEINGRKTWTVRYGFGDALALAASAISPGQLTLDQTLAVDIHGEALSILTIEGHFDDQEAAGMQTLSVYLDVGRLHGVFGDFVVPEIGDFSSFSRKMKGARLDYDLGFGTFTAVASQFEGVSETRTFVGQTAEDEVVYSFLREDGSSTPPSYLANLNGLASFELRSLFVEEFADVTLRIDAAAALQAILTAYGVSELGPVLAGFEGLALQEQEYVVVGEAKQVLLLRSSPATLVREAIQEAISLYNDASSSDSSVSYPFVQGGEVELRFLADVGAISTLVVGGDVYGLGDAVYHRFYDLRVTNVVADSVAVEVDPDGSGYLPVTDPLLVGYETSAYAAEGILEVSFPESFFDNTKASMRISFSYTVTGGTYLLGFSIIPDSDRVTLNGRVLQRDVDYMIDYEVGLLALLVDVGDEDVIVVEFERYSSGLGSTSDYARYFLGASIDLPLSDEFTLDAHLLAAVDDPNSVSNPSSVSTMPNRQVVAGVSGTVSLPDLDADFTVGYGSDLYPFDDNERIAAPNAIRSIAGNQDYVFVGHDTGFSAYTNGVWRSYGTANGLSGRQVRAIAADEDRVYIGTNGGLTVIDLVGVSPLARAANWSRYGEIDGLPDVSVRALLLTETKLWVGTDGGLAVVDLTDLAVGGGWTSYTEPQFQNVRALVLVGEDLYVGTTDGLFLFSPASGEVEEVTGTAGLEVRALAYDAGSLYVASDRGVEAFVGGVGAGWLIWNTPVTSLAALSGEVVYGTDNGWARASNGVAVHTEWKITAVGVVADQFWAGSEANASYQIRLWEFDGAEKAFDGDVAKIDGKNRYVYQDPKDSEHTLTGWIVRSSFVQQAPGFSLSGAVERVLPGFRAIGRTSREDVASWSLNGEFELGPSATLHLTHSYEMTSPGATDSESRLEDGLSFVGSFGPQLTFSIQHDQEDSDSFARGPDSTNLSYRLGVSDDIFNEAARLAVTWTEGFAWAPGAAQKRSSRLSADARVEWLPDLVSSFSWVRPVSVKQTGWSGSEDWTADTTWDFQFSGIVLSTEYDFEASRDLPNGPFDVLHSGRVFASISAFPVVGWTLTPNLELTGKIEDGSTSLTGKLTARTTKDAFSGRTTLTAEVSGLGERVERWTEKASSTWSYNGANGFRPSLTYSGSRSVVRYEGVGTKATWNHSLNGRSTWVSDSGATDSLSVALRLQTGGDASFSGTLDNTFQQDVTSWFAGWFNSLASVQTGSEGYPRVSLRNTTALDYRVDSTATDASWTVGAGMDVALSPVWSAAFSTSYTGGAKETGTWYNGLVLELTVAIDF